MGTLTDAVQAEIDLRLKDAELSDRLIALKSDPDADPKELRAVKDELRAERFYWRQIREFFGTDPGEGGAVVTPAVLEAGLTIPNVGATDEETD